MAIMVPKGTGRESEKKSEVEKMAEEKTVEREKSEVDEIEEKYPLNLAETVAFLRELADTLERGGTVEMSFSQRQVKLKAEEPVTLEISYKEDAKKKKIEVELEIKEHFGAAGKEGGRPEVR